MAPPRKPKEEGEVKVHASYGPLSAPLSFVSPTIVCMAIGGSLCIADLETGQKSYIHTEAYSITKLCANPTRRLVAFCEGGTNPKVFVYKVFPEKPSLLLSISDVTELELSDLAFSRCGSRIYALSRATSKRLAVYSSETGQRLPGCELSLPLRFDKVVVYPGHKDHVALVRSSSVRIVNITKSFETYIMKLQPSSLPVDSDLAVSAYAWTSTGHFLVATRKGLLCTLDGKRGTLIHVCQVEQPITSISFGPGGDLATAHIGNSLRFFSFEPQALPTNPTAVSLSDPKPMEGNAGVEGSVFFLRRVVDLEGRGSGLRGQTACIQASPDLQYMLVTTAEGEVWRMAMPSGGQNQALGDDQEVWTGVEELGLKLLFWFHTGPVSDAVLLGRAAHLAATVDEGGRLRILELVRGGDAKGLRTLTFTSGLTSVACNGAGDILVVGNDCGCLHLVSVKNWRKPVILDTLRVSEAGIAKVCVATHSDSHLSIVALLFNGSLACSVVNIDDGRIRMFGCIELPGKVEDICINLQEFGAGAAQPMVLAVGTSSSSYPCIWTLRAPASEPELAQAQIKCGKLSHETRADMRPTAVASLTRQSFLVGFAGGELKTFQLPTSEKMSAKQALLANLQNLPPMSQLVTRLQVGSREGDDWILAASMDGSVRRYSISGMKVEMQKVLHSVYSGGVLLLGASEDGNVIISSGGADGLLIWSNKNAQIEISPVLDEEADADLSPQADDYFAAGGEVPTDVDDQDMVAFPLWVPSGSEATHKENFDADEAVELDDADRKAIQAEVEVLRKRLQFLIDSNENAQDIEKLERMEFCVDFEERDAIAATSQQRCDALRAEIEKENLVRQMLKERLIKEFWEPMRGKGCQIVSLSSSLTVSNFPVRTVTDEESGMMRKLKNLRRVELLEQAAAIPDNQTLKADAFATGDESYIVNWWGKARAQGAAEGDVKELLYEPFELLTNSRRRVHINLLQALTADSRSSFNEFFKTCQGDKRGVIDQIKEKCHRIRAILGELQIEEKVVEPELCPEEDAESVLKVQDKEILAEKWISADERKLLDEAKAKEEERLRQLRENDAGQRALVQMMGGTLKTKKDLSALEISLDREPWMDLPDEQLTDLQRQALKEFEEKEKALAVEQDKYRQQLDAELKKLRQDVQDLTNQFETTLKELRQKRFECDANIFCQELYCVRLQLALLQSGEDSQSLAMCSLDLESFEARLETAATTLEEFQSAVSEAKSIQEEKLRKEREAGLIGPFRTQLQNQGVEPDAINALLQLFRRKRDGGRQRTGVEPGSPQTTANQFARRPSAFSLDASETPGWDPFNAAAVGDPYPDLGTEAEREGRMAAADQEPSMADAPDGVTEANFNRMLELRGEKIEAEAEVQQGATRLQEMSGLLAHLQKELEEANNEVSRQQMELQEHRQLMDREQLDIEILFKLKQGQVEVPQAAVVTDYSDAIVIEKEVIECRNRRLLELGKEKINTLDTIKEFRKKLNFLQWEHKMLALQTLDLEERTKDVHMLRVTKDLQMLLKGGEEGRNKADQDLLERKLEHLNTTTEQKEQALKKQGSISSHALKLRKNENTMLETKLRELQQNVIQREHIRRLRAPQGGGAGATHRSGERPKIIGGGGRIEENEAVVRAAQTNFKEVRVRQTLVEAAKKHSEQIVLLRKELDRLRQKTFPSFVQLNEDRPANPDTLQRS